MFKKIIVVLFMLFSVKAYAGADVNVQDDLFGSWTALMTAQDKGYTDIIKGSRVF